MFCKRKYTVEPGNGEQVRKMSTALLQKRYQFVAGTASDVLRGWCESIRVQDNGILVLTDVILDMSKDGKQREYQEHSELRFFNTPFAAFVNEERGGEVERVPGDLM
jgi:hypothetical protein